MINDTLICTVAKKLHNINPSVIIDDPLKVEALLRDWWSDPTIDNRILRLAELSDAEGMEFHRWYIAHTLHSNEGTPS